MALSFAQLEQLWTQAGGSPQYAPTAAGIALAESGGNPAAWNKDSATGDNSVGLFQINYFGNLAPSRTQQFGPPQGLTDPLANAKAAVALSGNGANWNPWSGDPVGNAALASPSQPLSAAQVQSILASSGRSSGSATTGAATPANLTAASGGGGVIPSTPPPVPSGLNALNVGSDFVWLGQFAAWTVFTALIFVMGVLLLLLGAVMLGVVILGPVVGPAGDVLPGPVGRVLRSGKGNAIGAPARTVAAARRPRTRTSAGSGSRQVFAERHSLQEQRHEHRMTEIEHRASARRSTQQRPRSSSFDEPFPE